MHQIYKGWEEKLSVLENQGNFYCIKDINQLNFGETRAYLIFLSLAFNFWYLLSTCYPETW